MGYMDYMDIGRKSLEMLTSKEKRDTDSIL